VISIFVPDRPVVSCRKQEKLLLEFGMFEWIPMSDGEYLCRKNRLVLSVWDWCLCRFCLFHSWDFISLGVNNCVGAWFGLYMNGDGHDVNLLSEFLLCSYCSIDWIVR
jgi:hypothetical protein